MTLGRLALWGIATLLLVGLLAVFAQEYRYLRVRRDVVHDRQALLHSPSAFHVVTLLELAPRQELLAAVRDFVDNSARAGGEVIYAGKVAALPLQSAQLAPVGWDAIVLVQYPSRATWDAAAADADYRRMRARFAGSYALGMRRSRWLNLGVPVALLASRIFDHLTLQADRYPFAPAAQPAALPPERARQRDELLAGLRANRDYGADAIVVLNFLQQGDAAQRAANAGYAREMLRLMAEVGNGPMHLGAAETLEGDARFDQVALVYYPGVDYFSEMLESSYFTGIVDGKQVGDTLASPTVPLLPHL